MVNLNLGAAGRHAAKGYVDAVLLHRSSGTLAAVPVMLKQRRRANKTAVRAILLAGCILVVLFSDKPYRPTLTTLGCHSAP